MTHKVKTPQGRSKVNWDDEMNRQAAIAEAMEAAKAIAIADATELLPVWFVPRMMEDEWHFAFIMANGDIVYFSHIDAVHQSVDGGLWLDVSLSYQTCNFVTQGVTIMKGRHITAPTTRTMASINARHIMMAFETADT